MTEDLAIAYAAFKRKRKQRLVEYAVLIGLQVIITVGLASETNPVFAVGFSVSAFGTAWSLAFAREQRRTLGEHSTKRLWGDTIESFGLMFFILTAGITAQFLALPRMGFMAHLAVIVLMYFLGSLSGELRWQQRLLFVLTTEEQINYIANLNRSIIFPYNIPYLRHVFGFGRLLEPSPKKAVKKTSANRQSTDETSSPSSDSSEGQ